jgi:hypothetical protein
VDGKIITDLTELSRNRAFADAVLLGGDEDLRIGVELAQEYGTRVHLLTIEGSSSSPTLRQESDTVTTIARTDIQTFLTVRSVAVSATAPTVTTSASPVVVPPTGPGTTVMTPATPPTTGRTSISATPTPSIPPVSFATTIDAEIKGYLAGLSDTERVSLTAALKTGAGVPVEHDGRLLARTRSALGRPLDQPEKAKLRRGLKKELGI